MPSLIDIRRRIRSTKSTQQITKAMKMVSSSKLRRAQDRIVSSRPYAQEMLRVFNNLATRVDPSSHPLLKEAIAYCESVRDYVSREVLEEILSDTEEHIDHLETQIELIAQVGEQNWLQSQMGDAS